MKVGDGRGVFAGGTGVKVEADKGVSVGRTGVTVGKGTLDGAAVAVSVDGWGMGEVAFRATVV